MNKDKIKITNAVKLGEWREVEGISLPDSTETFDGLIISGKEMLFAGRNFNGEAYAPTAFDNFINAYFIKHELNMPVNVMHDSRPEWLVGRVVSMEVSEDGVSYMVYIPRTIANYATVKTLLANGILQGFSKEGYATTFDFVKDDDTGEEYIYVTDMWITAVSLVDVPANGLKFDSTEETKTQNALKYKHINSMDSLFND